MAVHPLLTGLEEVRRNWGWFLALGIVLMVLGFVAIGAAGLATLASVIVFGWIVFLGGVVEAVSSFWARQWSGFFLELIVGILYAVAGLLIVAHPVASAAGLTLLLAALFLTSGLFRMGAAVAIRYPNWGWCLLDGAISVLLGAMIWAEWPSSTLWVIGTFVGISLLFRGWAWVMFALAARQLPSFADATRPPKVDSGASPAIQ